ncbi:DUF2207 domain-containing protein [Nostoc sp. PCC 7107]|uniref:DUF2207 domain-containing protein n=1 Tax=Nostoc sp. PCC 7107 TaxID=317936 RepID=UPI00029F2360|nr:DUF2207 domain-containing protein [Nostoc sp. PCC 7107]AFY42518.1 Protein of unknown function DUF2207, membrane [Nostoc sp. PCC 7107]
MWTKHIQRLCLFCLGLFLILGLSINHATAQSPPFYWEFMNVNIAVQTNGDMLITEMQKYTFTGDYKNQRYRYIPIDKLDKITEVSVSENGKLLPTATGVENNQLWIRWEHQLNPPESHTFVLKYRVIGGLHVNDNNAKVYWKAIFADRQASINQAKVTVELPEQFAASIKDFQSYGVSADIRQVNTKIIEFVAKEAIKPKNELEVQVTFDRTGTNVTTPQWQNSQFQPNSSGFWWLFWLFFLVIFLFSSSNNRSKGGGGGGGDGGGCGGGGCGGGGCGGGGCGGGGCGGGGGG